MSNIPTAADIAAYTQSMIDTLDHWQELIDQMNNLPYLDLPPSAVLFESSDDDPQVHPFGKDTVAVSRIRATMEHGHTCYSVFMPLAVVNGVPYHRFASVRVQRDYNHGTDTYSNPHLAANTYDMSRTGSYSSGEVSAAAARKLNDYLVSIVEFNGGSLEHLTALEPALKAFEYAQSERPYFHGKSPVVAARKIREMMSS